MRTIALAAILLLGCIVLLLVCLIALVGTESPARGLGVTTWKPLPSSEFVPLPRVGGSAAPQLSNGGSPRPFMGRGCTAESGPWVIPGLGYACGFESHPVSTPPSPRQPLPTHSITGVATWYSYVPGQAAAAKALRSFLGPDWRGTVVRVTGPNGSLDIALTDWESSLIPGRLIDLDSSDFRRLCGPLWRGVCSVEVSR